MIFVDLMFSLMFSDLSECIHFLFPGTCINVTQLSNRLKFDTDFTSILPSENGINNE